MDLQPLCRGGSCTARTRLFEGIAEVLAELEGAGVRWGVVTNKVERYVRPLMDSLGVLSRSATAVGGDTTPFAKPHPEPLLHAARLAAVDPARCVYVGDDARDIEAGRAAGMATVAAAYGFCGDASPPAQWGADALIERPLQLLGLLRRGQTMKRYRIPQGVKVHLDKMDPDDTGD